MNSNPAENYSLIHTLWKPNSSTLNVLLGSKSKLLHDTVGIRNSHESIRVTGCSYCTVLYTVCISYTVHSYLGIGLAIEGFLIKVPLEAQNL